MPTNEPQNWLNREDVHKKAAELNRNTAFMTNQLRQLARVAGVLDASAFALGLSQEIGTDKQVEWPHQPTAPLDRYTMEYMSNVLQHVAQSLGKTIVMIEMVDTTPEGEARPAGAPVN